MDFLMDFANQEQSFLISIMKHHTFLRLRWKSYQHLKKKIIVFTSAQVSHKQGKKCHKSTFCYVTGQELVTKLCFGRQHKRVKYFLNSHSDFIAGRSYFTRYFFNFHAGEFVNCILNKWQNLGDIIIDNWNPRPSVLFQNWRCCATTARQPPVQLGGRWVYFFV